MSTYFTVPVGASFALGVTSALMAGWILLPEPTVPLQAESHADDVHVHADFAVYLDHNKRDFTDERYQSLSGAYQHDSLHLHSFEDHVIHRHADGVTMGDFFTSLGYDVSDDSLTTDTGEQYTTNDDAALILFVNGEPQTNWTEYILEDEDQLLLYYGNPDDPRLADYQAKITDESCIYTGTCPERGVAPPEECGLTCDI